MNELYRRLLFLPPQSSTVAASIDHLHYFVITVTMLGAAGVVLLAAWFCIRYARPRDEEPAREQPAARVPPALEIGIVTGLLVLFLGWWWIGFRQYVRVRVAPEGSYDIYVTAKQWMWKFSYADGNHALGTLFVPTGRPVRLLMSSRDVIHSFYVPDFRIKQDLVPGRYTTAWFQVDQPGRHQILCAEYCGTGHSRMRGEVIALDPADFSRWLASGAAPALARTGEDVAAEKGCLRCHTLDGTPHIGPSWAHLYRARVPLEGGGSAVADEAFLTESMMDPNARIHAGYRAVMPSYLGLLRPAETAALVALIKSLEHVRTAPQDRLPPPSRDFIGPVEPGEPAAPGRLP